MWQVASTMAVRPIANRSASYKRVTAVKRQAEPFAPISMDAWSHKLAFMTRVRQRVFRSFGMLINVMWSTAHKKLGELNR